MSFIQKNSKKGSDHIFCQEDTNTICFTRLYFSFSFFLFFSILLRTHFRKDNHVFPQYKHRRVALQSFMRRKSGKHL